MHRREGPARPLHSWRFVGHYPLSFEKTIICPSYWISIDIIPDFFKFPLISNHMIMKGPLPDGNTRGDFMDHFCDMGFIGTDHVRQCRGLLLQTEERMDMIGHHHGFDHLHMRIMQFHLQKCILCNHSKFVQRNWSTEQQRLIGSTDRHKIIILRSVIIRG